MSQRKRIAQKRTKTVALQPIGAWTMVYYTDCVVRACVMTDQGTAIAKNFNVFGALIKRKPRAKHFRTANAWADKMMKIMFQTPHRHTDKNL